MKPSTKIAQLKHIGTPTLDAKALPVEVGDTVMYKQDMDFEVSVDGEDVFMMRQEELLCKVG